MPASQVLDVGGHEVTVTNPERPVFPELGLTKLDLVRYYLAVAEGALRGAGNRPNGRGGSMKRQMAGALRRPA